MGPPSRVLELQNTLRSDQVSRQRLFQCRKFFVPSISLSAQRTFSEAPAPVLGSLQQPGRIKAQAWSEAVPR